jgi:phosphopantetheinyl transferase
MALTQNDALGPPQIYRWDEISGMGSTPALPPMSGVIVILLDARSIVLERVFSEAIFSAHELERARRYHFDLNRTEFLAARGIVRSYVAHGVGLRAEAIVFEAGPNEKPRLLNPECAGIDVSLAHAGGRVACGFVRHGHIGVDIESLEHRAIHDAKDLSRLVFSASEMDLLEQSSQSDFPRLFVRGWTRKEAVLKGSGLGLSVDPRTVDVFRRSDAGLEEPSHIRFQNRDWSCTSTAIGADLDLSVAYSEF